MKSNSRSRSVTRSIMGLFSKGKSVNLHQLNPKDYYRNYYLNEKLCTGVDFIAKIERVSKKAAVEHLMERGISSYLGEMIGLELRLERAAREKNEVFKRTRFVLELIKFAKARGMDISKFF